MNFLAPQMLLGLLLVPVAIGFYLWAQRRRSKYAVRFTNLDLLANLTPRRPAWRRHLPSILPRPHSLNQSLKPPHDQNLVYIASPTYPVRKTRGQTEKKGSPHFLPQTFLNLLLLHVVLHVWILGRDRLAGSCS